MTKSEFVSYKNVFIEPTRTILSNDKSPALYESAFPAYANPNPLINFLFWQRVQKVMQYLEKRKPFRHVMDFGCGGGVMLPFLSQIAQTVVALDIDLEPITKMQSLINFSPSIEILDGQQHPLDSFKPASFDLILALDVLEHVDDLDLTLQQLGSLLIPGGEIIVCGPTENIFYQLGRKFAGSDYSGDYHVRNIYDIKDALSRVTEVQTMATLYYPLPLFKIYRGTVH
jgi:SAM-dependent methyltransferase